MDKQYIFTERAHLMCPNMYFGIAVTVNHPMDPAGITAAFETLAEAHPFLRARVGYEKECDRYYYDIGTDSRTELFFMEQELPSLSQSAILEEYQRLTKRDWDLLWEGMLKVVCWKMQEKTCVLLVFHHLLADGRSALHLATEFARLYVKNEKPKSVAEHLIASTEDLPAGSRLPLISRLLIQRCNRKWKKENRAVTYEEYHQFADTFLQKDTVRHSVQVYEKTDADEMAAQCKKHAVSINDLLLAKMMIGEHTDKIIIAQDIRDQLSCYRNGALGNYSTAFSVVYKVKSDDAFREAESVRKIVRKNAGHLPTAMTVLQCYAKMNAGLLDAAAISALGGFSSRAGQFVGSNMFGFGAGNGCSITNLGKQEEPSIEDAMFIPPASPAMRKTLGVLTMNGKMVICSSERDGGEL